VYRLDETQVFKTSAFAPGAIVQRTQEQQFIVILFYNPECGRTQLRERRNSSRAWRRHSPLIRFRVQNFRSVEDSGWVDVDRVTALIGTNESGKTNLVVPLWKLKPAKNGEIDPLADFPRKRYNEIRTMEKKPIFIRAEFRLSAVLAQQVANLLRVDVSNVQRAIVSRDLGGQYYAEFPDANVAREIEASRIVELFAGARTAIADAELANKSEETLREAMIEALADAQKQVNEAGETLDEDVLEQVKETLGAVDVSKPSKRSTIVPRYGQVTDSIDEELDRINEPSSEDAQKARSLVASSLPSFVYYSNYGNLDSEIYLPHVIDNLKRKGLGAKEEAKARTLKVLFEFVKLKAEEILELGKDAVSAPNQTLTTEEIELSAQKKKERSVLLHSASTDLTAKFRDWWKQGDYRFRFEADGDHFRIWVVDDKRPEDIELEGRSTGLQWFLSFFLVFLVESQDSHRGAILLLDEPGLSLHPLAQRDLSAFFEGLSATNQLVYTTHSPFLVDSDHLDRVKAVFIDDKGLTQVSANLRAGEKNPAQTKSIYAVHAALGLSVSDPLLQGCQPVIVEGPSDQYYFSAMKNYLIGRGMLAPPRELMFVPGGGVRGISAVVSIVAAKDEELPYVVVDSDSSGLDLAKKLMSGTYQSSAKRLLMVGDLIDMGSAEVEDLMSVELIAKIASRNLLRQTGIDKDFEDEVKQGFPVVPQIETVRGEPRYNASSRLEGRTGEGPESCHRIQF
jgi:AAA ATPase domain